MPGTARSSKGLPCRRACRIFSETPMLRRYLALRVLSPRRRDVLPARQLDTSESFTVFTVSNLRPQNPATKWLALGWVGAAAVDRQNCLHM